MVGVKRAAEAGRGLRRICWLLLLLAVAGTVAFWWPRPTNSAVAIATLQTTPIGWLTDHSLLLADPSANHLYVYDVIEHKAVLLALQANVAGPVSHAQLNDIWHGTNDIRFAVPCASLSGPAGTIPLPDLVIFSLNSPGSQTRIKGFFYGYQCCFLLRGGMFLAVDPIQGRLALFDRTGRIVRTRWCGRAFGVQSSIPVLLPNGGATRENTILAFNGTYGASTVSGAAIPVDLKTAPASTNLSMPTFARWAMCWPATSPDGRSLGWIGSYYPDPTVRWIDNALRRVKIYAPSNRQVIWTTDTAGRHAHMVQIVPGTAGLLGWVPGSRKLSYCVPVAGPHSHDSVEILTVNAGA